MVFYEKRLLLYKETDFKSSGIFRKPRKSHKFFDYVMQGTKGMKMPRGDKNQILKFSFPCPSLEVQKKVLKEFENYDSEIAKATALLPTFEAKKIEILTKFLN